MVTVKRQLTIFFALGSALLAACSPSPPVAAIAAAASPQPTSSPVASPSSAPQDILGGQAAIDGKPFAGAQVTVTLLGKSTPLGTASVDGSGLFQLTLPASVPSGAALRVTAHKQSQSLVALSANVIAAGGGNVIAAGGGNVIAAGGGNVIAAGGGNVIAAGGGNVIAAGGGNVIAAGGGNLMGFGVSGYHVEEDTLHEGAVLSLESTLTYTLLNKRFEATGEASVSRDGQAQGNSVQNMLTIYGQLRNVVVQTIGAIPDHSSLTDLVTSAASTNGELPPSVVGALDTSATLGQAFVQAADSLVTVTNQAASQTGIQPDAGLLTGVSLGSFTASDPLSNSVDTGVTQDPSPSPSPVTATGSVSLQPGLIVDTSAPPTISAP